MKALEHRALFSCLVLLSACGRQLVEFPAADAGRADTRPDAPAADVPVTGTGGAGVDAARGDAMDAPRVDAVDAPGADGSGSDAPRIDASDASDGPRVDAVIAPDASDASDAPRIDAMVAPDAIDAPAVDAPGIDAPRVDAADAANPDLSGPDASDAVDLGRFDAGDANSCSQLPVVLGAAVNFAVLAGPTVTNSGLTTVTGDLGTFPGAAIAGFGPGVVVGMQHPGDTAAMLAQGALTTAYNDAKGRTLCPISVSGNLGGMTLTPGLYKSTDFLEISSGNLTLDALGDPNAVFIFQMATTMITGTGRLMILAGLAKASNIFWQVGSSATLGGGSVFQGTIMADQTIILNTGAVLNGRALARVAGVTLDTNMVTLPP